MPSGKIINYQGYENLALDELIKIYKEDDIENERHKVPTIIYFKNSKEYNYYPDIYIKSKNLIIEVKSDWTYKKQLIENILKALYVRKSGFNYEIWIYKRDNKEKIVI
jgi:Uma2 family endonuclease